MNKENACWEIIRHAKKTGLQILDLSFMNLSVLPESILELEYLVELNLNSNSFTRLPYFINKLKYLKRLHLRNNCFSYTGGIGFDPVNNLEIEYIDLSRNILSRIPEEIFYLDGLEEVNLTGNPFMNGIPISIINKGYLAIHQFVEELYYSETSDKLLEAKLIFVGQGEVGKTSLMKKVLDPDEKIIEGYEPTTHGINVRKWHKEVYFSDQELKYILNEKIETDDDDEEDEEDEDDYYCYSDEIEDEDDKNVTSIWDLEEEYYDSLDNGINVELSSEKDEYYNPFLEDIVEHKEDFTNETPINNNSIREQNLKDAQFNIWDFGGQEIYYSTHQFFLTRRSIYIFVWDARKEEDYDRFLYWFNTINILSEKSPIIVVMNKSDIREKSIEETSLVQNFPNIINFHKTSCLTGKGIKELVSSIDLAFKKLPHVGDKLPKDWLSIRRDLYELKENHITYEK